MADTAVHEFLTAAQAEAIMAQVQVGTRLIVTPWKGRRFGVIVETVLNPAWCILTGPQFRLSDGTRCPQRRTVVLQSCEAVEVSAA